MRYLLAALILFSVVKEYGPQKLLKVSSSLANITANCRKPLGMASGTIKDEQITAPSAYDNDFARFGAHRARLNLTSDAPGYRADRTQSGGWIKIELEKQMVITAIATQGYGDPKYPEWTELYMVMYSNGGDYLYFQNPEGDLKTFTGNKDSNSIQHNEVPLPTIATSIMLMESGVHENFGIRMELFGCEPDCFKSCNFDTIPADFLCSSAVFEAGNKSMVCTQHVFRKAIITQNISKQLSSSLALDFPQLQIMLTTTVSNCVDSAFYLYHLNSL